MSDEVKSVSFDNFKHTIKHFFSVCTSQGTAPWVVNPNPQLHPTLSSLWAPPPKENYPTNHTNQIKTTKNQSQSLKIIQSLSFRTWRIQLEAYNLSTVNISVHRSQGYIRYSGLTWAVNSNPQSPIPPPTFSSLSVIPPTENVNFLIQPTIQTKKQQPQKKRVHVTTEGKWHVSMPSC